MVTGGTDLTDVKMKMCALAEECSEASVNLGVAQAVITSKCCTSDLCNTQDAPGNLHHDSWYFKMLLDVVETQILFYAQKLLKNDFTDFTHYVNCVLE